MDQLLSFPSTFLSIPQIHILIITILFFLTWYKSVRGGWLIDDDFGIAQFSDKFRVEQKKLPDGRIIPFNHPEYNNVQGELIPEQKVDYYEENGKKYKFLDYLPHLGFPGCFMRWHRLHIGKKFTVIAKNKFGHDIYGYVQDPFKHHIWSLSVFYVTCLLAYYLISNLFGNEIAFFSILLFQCHPVSTQSVAWISGINYIYSILFSLILIIICISFNNFYITIPSSIFFTWLSSLSILTGMFNWTILLLLGKNWEAFASALVSLYVFKNLGLGAISFRKQSFKEQNMERSTFLNRRKPIVVMKTIWYYFCLMIVPSRLGLYHEFGYHYDEKMEHTDGMFWKGLLVTLLLITLFFTSSFIVKFCILWMIVFLIPFMNIITANQFVVERYIFVPSLGFCILISYLFKDFKNILFLIIGLYMARTMCHLWSFLSTRDFYLSNWLNFRKSEVSLGNLGVTLINEGKTGSAIDTWQQAAQINPYYDVSWYNLYSVFKSNGLLNEAKGFLENCLRSKTVHFKDKWEAEYKELIDLINKRNEQQSKIIPPSS